MHEHTSTSHEWMYVTCTQFLHLYPAHLRPRLPSNTTSNTRACWTRQRVERSSPATVNTHSSEVTTQLIQKPAPFRAQCAGTHQAVALVDVQRRQDANAVQHRLASSAVTDVSSGHHDQLLQVCHSALASQRQHSVHSIATALPLVPASHKSHSGGCGRRGGVSDDDRHA